MVFRLENDKHSVRAVASKQAKYEATHKVYIVSLRMLLERALAWTTNNGGNGVKTRKNHRQYDLRQVN